MAQKEAVDAKSQLKKLETPLEHEKQLKTEVDLRNVSHVHTHTYTHTHTCTHTHVHTHTCTHTHTHTRVHIHAHIHSDV